jgi:hypothetical protein
VRDQVQKGILHVRTLKTNLQIYWPNHCLRHKLNYYEPKLDLLMEVQFCGGILRKMLEICRCMKSASDCSISVKEICYWFIAPSLQSCLWINTNILSLNIFDCCNLSLIEYVIVSI